MRILFFFLLSILSACSFEHIAELKMQNNNPNPIILHLHANNLTYTSDTLRPFSKKTEQWNWSTLSSEKGHVLLTVQDVTTGKIDSFIAGNFTNGVLANYIDITLNGNQAQITLSD